ncbi:MAG: histidine phosphatase family protein [Halofilum sp. (in: g-proteobacteria)]|nr:histidine phosphatase family protein [Halofilum sp. (in: g-proteobacteria)]
MSTATRVDLLRRGEAAGGRRLRGAATDDPLSPRGRADMERVLAGADGWDAIVTSPMQRCHAFAQAAAAALDLPLGVDARLVEYDFGAWSGRELDALWADAGDALAAFFADPDARTPPGGEAAPDFRARVRAAWADLLARHAGTHVLVVGHGGVLRQLVTDTLGATRPMHHALAWPNAALSRLEVFEDPEYGRSTRPGVPRAGVLTPFASGGRSCMQICRPAAAIAACPERALRANG